MRVLPPSYYNPGIIAIEGFYYMPWINYDKFDQNDKRLERLLAKWPTVGGGTIDGRAKGYLGAVPMKYGIDPTSKSWDQGVDIIVWRYADVLLLLAEAINETQGPATETYSLINTVRNRAGLNSYPDGTFTKDQFKAKIMDERLFELWSEDAIRKEDLIRWGTFIQNAINRGSITAKSEFVLYPLPRRVINESGGAIKQNPGY